MTRAAPSEEVGEMEVRVNEGQLDQITTAEEMNPRSPPELSESSPPVQSVVEVPEERTVPVMISSVEVVENESRSHCQVTSAEEVTTNFESSALVENKEPADMVFNGEVAELDEETGSDVFSVQKVAEIEKEPISVTVCRRETEELQKENDLLEVIQFTGTAELQAEVHSEAVSNDTVAKVSNEGDGTKESQVLIEENISPVDKTAPNVTGRSIGVEDFFYEEQVLKSAPEVVAESSILLINRGLALPQSMEDQFEKSRCELQLPSESVESKLGKSESELQLLPSTSVEDHLSSSESELQLSSKSMEDQIEKNASGLQVLPSESVELQLPHKPIEDQLRSSELELLHPKPVEGQLEKSASELQLLPSESVEDHLGSSGSQLQLLPHKPTKDRFRSSELQLLPPKSVEDQLENSGSELQLLGQEECMQLTNHKVEDQHPYKSVPSHKSREESFKLAEESEPSDGSDSGLGSDLADSGLAADLAERCSDSGLGSELAEDAKLDYPLPVLEDLKPSGFDDAGCLSLDDKASTSDSEPLNIVQPEALNLPIPIVYTSVPKRSNLKRKLDSPVEVIPAKKRSIRFRGVSVYYFPRTQGFTCVPSQGGSTLGMSQLHSHVREFTLQEHSLEQRRVHRLMIQKLRSERLTPPSDTDDSDSEEEPTDEEDEELDLDNYYFLQVPLLFKETRIENI